MSRQNAYLESVRKALSDPDFGKKLQSIGLLGALRERQTEVLRPADPGRAQSNIELTIGPELVQIHANAAAAVTGFRGKGKAYKKLIDGLATDVHVRGYDLLANVTPQFDLQVVQGEGGKDDSVGLFTGARAVRDLIIQPARDQSLLIDLNIDPVDGTTPVAVMDRDKDGRPVLAALGTSITSFGLRPEKGTSFLRVPDTASIFIMATPLGIPHVQLDLRAGGTFKEMVVENVRRVAVARLSTLLRRKPGHDEVLMYIQNQLRVCSMNRAFQNVELLDALKAAGMRLNYRLLPDQADIDFSDWEVSGVNSENKNCRKGNLALIGDGNVSALLMEGVDLLIGNSGSVEAVQIATMASDIQGVFMSKELRKQYSISALVDAMRESDLGTDEEKTKAFTRWFPGEKERREFTKVQMPPHLVMSVLGKHDFIRTEDYLTVISAITPLGGPGVFTVPGADGVTLDETQASARVTSYTINSAGEVKQHRDVYDVPALTRARALRQQIGREQPDEELNQLNAFREKMSTVTQVCMDLWKLDQCATALELLRLSREHLNGVILLCPDPHSLTMSKAKVDIAYELIAQFQAASASIAAGQLTPALTQLEELLAELGSDVLGAENHRLIGYLRDDLKKISLKK